MNFLSRRYTGGYFRNGAIIAQVGEFVYFVNSLTVEYGGFAQNDALGSTSGQSQARQKAPCHRNGWEGSLCAPSRGGDYRMKNAVATAPGPAWVPTTLPSMVTDIGLPYSAQKSALSFR